MDAPQSRDEVEVIERELRRLDDAIRIEWEPHAVMVTRGGYDANGKVINPRYDGRWKIVKKADPFRTAMWREDSLITYVTEQVIVGSGTTKVYAMKADGDYRPVGWWLVEHMRSWDRANREAVEKASAVLDEWNAKSDAAKQTQGESGEAERLDEMFFHGTMRGGVSTQHPVGVTLTTQTKE